MIKVPRSGGIGLTVLLCGLLAGCGTGSTGGATSVLSGVQGQATRGPIESSSPVGVINTAPLPNVVIVVQRQDGTEVARQKTDLVGKYKIGLAPGAYQVVGLAPSGSLLPTPPAPQLVTVAVNQYVTVNVAYDTGIRF